MPEVPAEVEVEGGSLRDLLVRLFAGTPVARELVNPRTGEMRLEGLFERKQAGKSWARPGQIRVSLSAPVRFGGGETAEEIARELERRVGELGSEPSK